MKELRENALTYKQNKDQERDKRNAEERDKQKKFAVREQMRVNESFYNIPTNITTLCYHLRWRCKDD